MSRIHDALKKAEEEREASQANAVLTVPEAHVASAFSDTRTAVAEPSVPIHTRSAVHAPDAPLTIQNLLAGCAQRDWKLDPKIAELFQTQNHVVGSEELRTLRSRLYQLRDRQPLRTVLITSALPAEGKTFLTACLAHMIVRQHERRALIIDADLRHSQMHVALGAPSGPGLTDYLNGAADEAAVLQRGPRDNLFLIPGGKPVSNPAELLANGRLKALLERVGPLFDWILLDSPPSVPVSDAGLMAAYCDGVLLVVQAASTPFDLAQKARDEFRDKGLLGVVLNQVGADQTYHSYYYDYQKKAKQAKKPK